MFVTQFKEMRPVVRVVAELFCSAFNLFAALACAPNRSFHVTFRLTSRLRFQQMLLNSNSSRLGSRPTYLTRR